VLVALRAKNFILIDELELSLGPGLNVLTGETGAGKSILVGALDLLLGGRASAAAVRPGAREAEVEALFDTEGSAAVAARLEASGIPHDGELVIRRVIGPSRSRAYLNGHMSGTAELAALAPELADVASQHESVALTDPQTHLAVLDRFGRIEADRLALSAEVDELVALVRAIEAAKVAHAERREREAFLSFQLHAIQAVDPQPGELEALHDERSRLRHVARLGSATRRAAERLDSAEDALTDELARLARELGQAAELDRSLVEPVQRLDAATAELCEVGRELGRYAERLEADPARLGEVEERLFKLEQLLRQHGPTLDDVLTTRARLEAERELLETSDEPGPRLSGRARLEARARRAQGSRSCARLGARAAARLGATISRELGELGMGGARIEVDVTPLAGDGGPARGRRRPPRPRRHRSRRAVHLAQQGHRASPAAHASPRAAS
jgi:DNA repair protein RecN (Recombination protein N)